MRKIDRIRAEHQQVARAPRRRVPTQDRLGVTYGYAPPAEVLRVEREL